MTQDALRATKYDFLFEYENALCECGLNADGVDYDKLSDVRNKFANILESKLSTLEETARREERERIKSILNEYSITERPFGIDSDQSAEIVYLTHVIPEIDSLTQETSGKEKE